MPWPPPMHSEAIPLLAPLELVEEGKEDPRPACSHRVAESDRSTIHVHLLPIQTELLLASEVLGGEGLVEGETGPLEGETRGRNRTYCTIKRHFRQGIDARSADTQRWHRLVQPTRRLRATPQPLRLFVCHEPTWAPSN